MVAKKSSANKKPAAKKPVAAKGKVVAEKPSRIDRQMVRDLAALLDETGLAQIEWSEGRVSVKVSRGGVAVAPAGQYAAAPKASKGAEKTAAAPAPEDDITKHPGAVKSPMVGTVYVAAQPGAPAFVKVGDNVKEGDTILIVEAMKTMNPIAAPRGGRVTRILIKNQQPVEFGQVLLVIE